MNKRPLTKFESAVIEGIILITALILVAAIATGLFGCSSTGARITVSASTYANIGDIDWDTYKVPVLSIYLGPKTSVWINKDYHDVREIQVDSIVTNATSTLGIYSSDERKYTHTRIVLDANGAVTNAVTTASE